MLLCLFFFYFFPSLQFLLFFSSVTNDLKWVFIEWKIYFAFIPFFHFTPSHPVKFSLTCLSFPNPPLSTYLLSSLCTKNFEIFIKDKKNYTHRRKRKRERNREKMEWKYEKKLLSNEIKCTLTICNTFFDWCIRSTAKEPVSLFFLFSKAKKKQAFWSVLGLLSLDSKPIQSN